VDDRDVERGFWQAILDAWDDDTPRLIYADWLTDHDRPERAEIIRAQCAAERLPKDDPHRSELEQRARELLGSLLGDWAEEEAEFTFRRGFFESPHVPVPRFLRHAAEYAALGPVGEMRLDLLSWDELVEPRDEEEEEEDPCGSVEDFARLAECPALANWHGLAFGMGGDFLDPASFAALIRSPHLHALVSLLVYVTHAENAGLIAVASSPALSGLRRLHLSNFFVSSSRVTADAGTQALANSPHLTRLEELTFRVNRVRDEVGAELVGSNNFASLRCLDFWADGLGPATVAALLQSPRLTQLEELTLTGSAALWDDEQVRQLVAWPGLARLTRLFFGGRRTGLSDAGLRLLIAAPVNALRHLTLSGQGITSAGIAELVSLPALGSLETLDLSSTPVGDVGAAALLASPALTRLRILNLTSSPQSRISPANIEALRQRLGPGLHLIER
jgi:uncharacterized protein (TIGR02996 family)